MAGGPKERGDALPTPAAKSGAAIEHDGSRAQLSWHGGSLSRDFVNFVNHAMNARAKLGKVVGRIRCSGLAFVH